MEKRSYLSLTFLILSLFSLAVLIYWYRGNTQPLNSAEIAQYQQRLDALPEFAKGFINIEETLSFLRTDDGKPFYVVNLFNFKNFIDDAASLSGAESFSQFSSQVIPLWLSHGTHPVFASDISSRLNPDWHFISVVKYRSRRDMADIQTDPIFIEALPARLAATDQNLRLKFSGNVFPPLFLLLCISLGLAILLITLAIVRIGRRKSPN